MLTVDGLHLEMIRDPEYEFRTFVELEEITETNGDWEAMGRVENWN